MNEAVTTFDKVLASLIGLAILAVVVSRNAQTSSVLQSISSGFSQILGVVVSPVTQAAQNSASGGTGNTGQASTQGPGGNAGVADITGFFNGLTTSAPANALGAGANASDIVNMFSNVGSMFGG